MFRQRKGKETKKTKPPHEGTSTIPGKGVGTISHEMIRNCASEPAVIDGRAKEDASQADWDEAEQELKGGGN